MARAGSVVEGRVAKGGGIGIAWLDGPGEVACGNGIGMAWLV